MTLKNDNKRARILYQFNRLESDGLKDNEVRFNVTSKRINRYGEVMIPDGVKLDNYKKNPVFLWAHNIYEYLPPIGMMDIPSIEITPNKFDATVVFYDDEFATGICRRYKKGFLNATSIGFNPITTTDKPVLKGQTGITHLEWELRELSACVVPVDQGALVIKRDMIVSEMTELREFCQDHGYWSEDFDAIRLNGGEVYYIRSVIPYKSCPVDNSAKYDFDVRKHFGDTIEWDEFRKFFAYYDVTNIENESAYLLPHHVIDKETGIFSVSATAVRACIDKINGLNGGVNIPEADRQLVYTHLAKHATDAGIIIPEFRSYDKIIQEFNTLNKRFIENLGELGKIKSRYYDSLDTITLLKKTYNLT